mmetsp:Transcript_4514/g.12561  ORF Transcript_4514/g.12561 Transcript_4514/m.12561 type:complete len:97 (+) Transcript_4514:86-376(+)
MVKSQFRGKDRKKNHICPFRFSCNSYFTWNSSRMIEGKKLVCILKQRKRRQNLLHPGMTQNEIRFPLSVNTPALPMQKLARIYDLACSRNNNSRDG